MTAPPPDSLDRRDWIAGLEKGLGLLESFSASHPRMSATQAAQHCGLTRTAARRYLLTLAHLGYVGTDGKLFWLHPRVLRLGQGYLDSARLPRIVQPFLQRVTAGTQESAYLSVLDGDDVVYIARNGPVRAMHTGYVLGGRVPASVTAGGLVLLAERSAAAREAWLDQHPFKTFTSHTLTRKDSLRTTLVHVHAQGWALSEQQLELNYRGIAVPLRDRNGDAVAALSITMPMGFEPMQDAVDRVLPVLRETAQAMRNLI